MAAVCCLQLQQVGGAAVACAALLLLALQLQWLVGG
jgi:hypothetical protein